METTSKDLIDLQSAHVTQFSQDGIRGDWLVRKNITSEDLDTLPKCFTEEQVFEIMRFARKFELIAFNAGIDFQKQNQNGLLMAENNVLQKALKDATEHSEKLSAKLLTLLPED